MALPPVPLKDEQRALISHLAELVEKDGEIAFLRPWVAGDRPRNAITLDPYHGYNVFFTLFSEWLHPHPGPPLYLTRHQIEQQGGRLEAEARPVAVLYAGVYRPKPVAATERELTAAPTPAASPVASPLPLPGPDAAPIPSGAESAPKLPARFFCVSSIVYHLGDTAGVRLPKKTRQFIDEQVNRVAWTEEEQCNRLRGILEKASLCPVHYGGNQAYYSPPGDYIQMPALTSFRSDLDHLIALGHESVHATGAAGRLKRPTVTAAHPTPHDRAIEEIVAVVGSLLLCQKGEINPPEAQLRSWAGYLKSWDLPQILREHPEHFARALVWADLAHLYIAEPEKRPDYVTKRQVSDQFQLDFVESRVVAPDPIPPAVAALAAESTAEKWPAPGW
ncbi:MAG: zincin-like metallopeptidase domain-containing protein [Opitutaceae bacterium]|nr:zincin-like metallopeptidase domain-containing protein [Opitutaceae bacterium]